MTVVTAGGIDDLCRVITVLALYGITPDRLVAETEGCGLRVEASLRADRRNGELCANRMRVLACVMSAELRKRPLVRHESRRGRWASR
jgi:hypothetical protein